MTVRPGVPMNGGTHSRENTPASMSNSFMRSLSRNPVVPRLDQRPLTSDAGERCCTCTGQCWAAWQRGPDPIHAHFELKYWLLMGVTTTLGILPSYIHLLFHGTFLGTVDESSNKRALSFLCVVLCLYGLGMLLCAEMMRRGVFLDATRVPLWCVATLGVLLHFSYTLAVNDSSVLWLAAPHLLILTLSWPLAAVCMLGVATCLVVFVAGRTVGLQSDATADIDGNCDPWVCFLDSFLRLLTPLFSCVYFATGICCAEQKRSEAELIRSVVEAVTQFRLDLGEKHLNNFVYERCQQCAFAAIEAAAEVAVGGTAGDDESGLVTPRSGNRSDGADGPQANAVANNIGKTCTHSDYGSAQAVRILQSLLKYQRRVQAAAPRAVLVADHTAAVEAPLAPLVTAAGVPAAPDAVTALSPHEKRNDLQVEDVPPTPNSTGSDSGPFVSLADTHALENHQLSSQSEVTLTVSAVMAAFGSAHDANHAANPELNVRTIGTQSISKFSNNAWNTYKMVILAAVIRGTKTLVNINIMQQHVHALVHIVSYCSKQYGGQLHTYSAGCVVVTWGGKDRPVTNDTCGCAALTALDIIKAARFAPLPLQVDIGIASNQVSYGVVGNEDTHLFSDILGDAYLEALSLARLNELYQTTTILCSSSVSKGAQLQCLTRWIDRVKTVGGAVDDISQIVDEKRADEWMYQLAQCGTRNSSACGLGATDDDHEQRTIASLFKKAMTLLFINHEFREAKAVLDSLPDPQSMDWDPYVQWHPPGKGGGVDRHDSFGGGDRMPRAIAATATATGGTTPMQRRILQRCGLPDGPTAILRKRCDAASPPAELSPNDSGQQQQQQQQQQPSTPLAKKSNSSRCMSRAAYDIDTEQVEAEAPRDLAPLHYTVFPWERVEEVRE